MSTKYIINNSDLILPFQEINADLNIVGGLSSTTISATTYYGDGANLVGVSTQDTFVTGGTYSGDTVVFTNNTGGTFNVTGLTIGTTLSKTLFVDPSGNDSTAVKGNINKPYANLYAAKSAATSGDTIYVFPGTWTYDNRNTAGNPYNGQIDTLVNLWKDGVYYYFNPDCKIIFLNQTVSGENMYLFKPIGVNTTCTIKGYLEFSGDSIGADSSNGAVQYFIGNSDDNGFTFDSQTKSLTTTSNPIGVRGGTTTGQTGNVILYSDEINYTHLGNNVGQSAQGYAIEIRSIAPINFYVKVRKINSSAFGVVRAFGLTSTSKAIVEIDEASNNGDPAGVYTIAFVSNSSSDIVMNFNKLSYRTALWAIQSNLSTMNVILNANIFESSTSVRSSPTFGQSAGTFTFNGTVNINYNNRTLFENNGSLILNLNCDIIPTITSYTNVLIKQLNVGTTNFKGNIGGNFQGQVGVARNGRLNINNSTVTSNLTGGSIFSNDVTSTGITSVNNSTVSLNSSSNLFNGQYLKTNILNSQIKNSGSGTLFVNTTSTGDLQIHNSVLQSVSGSTINISGTAPLTTTNSSSNTTVSATTTNGSITVLSQLDIL